MAGTARRLALALALGSGLATAGALRAQETLRVFLGSLHDHSAEGGDDGTGEMAAALAAARQQGFDFFALTPHDHMVQEATYRDLVAKVQAATEPGKFVAFAGIEWGVIKKGGHVGLLGATAKCPAESTDWEGMWDFVARDPGEPLVVLNHPKWNRTFGGRPDQARDQAAALVEVLGGPSKADRFGKVLRPDNHHDSYLAMLDQGWRVGVAYGQDDHTGHWGDITRARMGVWANALEPSALLDGFRKHRTFATEDPGMRIWIQAGAVPMGGTAPVAETRLRVAVRHRDEAVSEVAVFFDADGPGGAPAEELAHQPGEARKGPDGFVAEATYPLLPRSPGAYALAVARDQSGDLVWSSPIWFGESGRWLDPPGGKRTGATDLNFASYDEIEAVPGIGRGLAKRIMETRAKGHLFLSVGEMAAVTGVDPVRLPEIEAALAVTTPEATAELVLEADKGLRSIVATGFRARDLERAARRSQRLLVGQVLAELSSGRFETACAAWQRLAAGSRTAARDFADQLRRSRSLGAMAREVEELLAGEACPAGDAPGR